MGKSIEELFELAMGITGDDAKASATLVIASELKQLREQLKNSTLRVKCEIECVDYDDLKAELDAKDKIDFNASK